MVPATSKLVEVVCNAKLILQSLGRAKVLTLTDLVIVETLAKLGSVAMLRLVLRHCPLHSHAAQCFARISLFT